MDFDLSAEQVALRDTAAELLDRHASSARVRAVVDAGGGFDRELWDVMVAQGWTAVVVPEAHGGLGLGFVEAAVLLEQLGAHVAPAPFLGHVVAQVLLCAAAGLPEGDVVDPAYPAESLIGELVAAQRIAAVAWRAIEAEPARQGGGWLLSGRTEPVVYAPSADVVVVRSADAVFVVDLADVGRPSAEPAMDRTREVGWLVFDRTPAARLGGPELVDLLIDVGAAAYSAELLGVADRSLQLSVAYAKDRQQFGRPIGSFQAVKHRCADMLVDVEGMRSSAYYAAWAVAAADGDRSLAASTAKIWCADAGRRVTASALQVHGGIGFTWESDVHLFLKRAQLDEGAFGDAVWHRTRLGALLRAKIEAGHSVI